MTEDHDDISVADSLQFNLDVTRMLGRLLRVWERKARVFLSILTPSEARPALSIGFPLSPAHTHKCLLTYSRVSLTIALKDARTDKDSLTRTQGCGRRHRL
ncbi:hypothetical protein MLD38_006951 [Melastoma candidum]|uniref:Uncharacterized protein n=1 Tax=Melastoma candidum TaxID=119954 RepID=A0ACB9RP77_9MYRT|nr:hypothetical protein MLD38_006951 [Melastoma candidum]